MRPWCAQVFAGNTRFDFFVRTATCCPHPKLLTLLYSFEKVWKDCAMVDTMQAKTQKSAQADGQVNESAPTREGYFGRYGGRYVPETLVPVLDELTAAYESLRSDEAFQKEFIGLLTDFVGRPTPLNFAATLSSRYGQEIWLKREDLCHTGAYKINNAIGQGLVAKRLGKGRIIAETGAGNMALPPLPPALCSGLDCVIYMGEEDMRRQLPNVYRMRLLGAEVRAVTSGTRTLKDAVNEALRDWVASIEDTHYIIGSALGPHPFPTMVRDFQRSSVMKPAP